MWSLGVGLGQVAVVLFGQVTATGIGGADAGDGLIPQGDSIGGTLRLQNQVCALPDQCGHRDASVRTQAFYRSGLLFGELDNDAHHDFPFSYGL